MHGGASIAAKQRVAVSFRLCLPSPWDMRVLSGLMSFLLMPRGFYKVQNRRYMLQALLVDHPYTYNDVHNCRQAMQTQMSTPIYRYGRHRAGVRSYYSRCALFRDPNVDLLAYIAPLFTDVLSCVRPKNICVVRSVELGLCERFVDLQRTITSS